jgi:3-dehydroquinate dehydratase/shikimate dehydrogenase
MHRFCLTLAETSVSTLERKLKHYSGQVQFIEVRLDYLPESPAFDLQLETTTQFLATCRPLREGGRFSGSEHIRLTVLEKATRAGFGWIDLEHDVNEDLDVSSETRIVRSLHAFDRFPADLGDTWAYLSARPGDVHKLALTVETTGELCRLLSLMERLAEEVPRTIIGMGTRGQLSRFLGGFLNNSWTYVAEDSTNTPAPGQFSVPQARGLYRLDSWSSCPQLVVGIGDPRRNAESSRILNPLFQQAGLAVVYLPADIDVLEEWFEFLSTSRLPIQGMDVGSTFEEDVSSFLESRVPGATAVDTLWKMNDGWHGLNALSSVSSSPAPNEVSSLRGAEVFPRSSGIPDLEARARKLGRQFAVWTGTEPNEGLVKEAVEREIGGTS